MLVQLVALYYAGHATGHPENRGGARNADDKQAKRDVVIQHIESFTCRASHYAHCRAPGRKYLPTDMSVRKTHEL